MLKEGVPYFAAILSGLAGASAAWLLFRWAPLLPVVGALALLLGVAAVFFRNPERAVPEGGDLVVAPADGRIVEVCEGVDPDRGTKYRKIAIFLSLWDVHVNRCPIAGRVENVEHVHGRFFPAFRSNAREINEHTDIGLSTEAGPVRIRQIAGMLARRVICRLRPGDRVRMGERFGMILLGSRVEVCLPDTVTIAVRVGDRVRGGESVIGAFERHA